MVDRLDTSSDMELTEVEDTRITGGDSAVTQGVPAARKTPVVDGYASGDDERLAARRRLRSVVGRPPSEAYRRDDNSSRSKDRRRTEGRRRKDHARRIDRHVRCYESDVPACSSDSDYAHGRDGGHYRRCRGRDTGETRKRAVRGRGRSASSTDEDRSPSLSDKNLHNAAVGGRTAGGTRRRTGENHQKSMKREDDVERSIRGVISPKGPAMKLRPYDGNTPWETFMVQFEICAQYNCWTETQKVAQLQCSLSGRAAQVLWDTTMTDVATYSQLVDLLKARFGSASQRERYVEELRSRRRRAGETLTDLHADIRRLFALAYASKVMDGDLSEAIARDYFISALNNPDLEIRVKERDPVNLDDALKAAIRAETHLKAYEAAADRRQDDKLSKQPRDNYRARHVKDTAAATETIRTRADDELCHKLIDQLEVYRRQTDEMSKELGRLRLLVDRNNDREGERMKSHATVGASGGPNRSASVICFKCGENGHYSRDCTSTGMKTAKKYDRGCFLCGLPGHFKRECPRRQGGPDGDGGVRDQPRVSNGIWTNRDETMTYLTVDFGRGPRSCLLDTGSEITLFPVEVVRHYEMQPTKQKVLAANGTDILIEGRVTARAVISGVTVFLSGFVTRHVDEVIIGIDALKQWKCVWNFQEGTVRLFGKCVELCAGPRRGRCCRVVLADEVCIPSHTEAIVPSLIAFGGRVRLDREATYATEGWPIQRGVYVARVVVPGRTYDVPVRLVNTNAADVRLSAGTTLGQLEPVEICDRAGPYCDRNCPRNCAIVHRDSTNMGTELCPNCASIDACECNTVLSATVSEEQEEAICAVIERVAPNVAAIDRMRLKRILVEHVNAFSFDDRDLGCTAMVKHRIDTGEARPCRQRLRRHPPAYDEIIRDQVRTLLEQGVIEPAQSEWASNVVIVRKKDNKYRMCIDYRMVNEVTKKDAYAMPRIDTCLDSLSGSVWFSTLDMRSSYHQILVDERDADKTAFVCREGQFRYRRLPFGLCNSGASFQRMIDLVLSGISYVTCLAYIDDIIVYSRTIDDHFVRLREVLKRLINAGLKCRPDKCTLLQTSVEFLGHVISGDGISVNPEKIRDVVTWPVPQNVRGVRAFLGLASYYRKFVLNFAEVARPLTDLLKSKNGRFIWTPAADMAFSELKRALTSSPILSMPTDDGMFILDTDASLNSIGAVLSQMQGGVERVIAYASRRLNHAETNYCTSRRELLAVVHFLRYFRCYLIGRPCRVRTDHAALLWLKRIREPVGQQARWLEELENYNLVIEHRPGRSHGNADAMSRKPCDGQQVASGRSCPLCDREVNDDNGCMFNCAGIVPASTKYCAANANCDDIVTMDELCQYVPHCAGSVSNCVPECAEIVSCDHIVPSTNMCLRGQNIVNHCTSVNLAGGVDETLWTKRVDVLSEINVGECQDGDGDISFIKTALQSGGGRPSWDDVTARSAECKILWRQWEMLIVRDDVLMRRFIQPGKEDAFQVVMPKTLRTEFIRHLHSGVGGSHLGRTRTEALVRQRAYWPGWLDDVDLVVKACEPCARYFRGKLPHRTPLKPILTGEPFEIVSVDVTGPHPTSYNGFNYILTAQDHFSRWTEAYPMRRHTAECVAKLLMDNWIARFGFPRSLLSDMGGEFEGTVIRELCRLSHVDKLRTTAYKPSTNGKLERFHRTLNAMLAKCVANNHRDWPDHLAMVTAAYRATKHESTGFSPNKIIFGREVRIPVDLIYNAPDEVGSRSVNQYVTEMVDRMGTDYELVRERTSEAVSRMKTQYDAKCRPQAPIYVGQQVWYYYPRRKSKISPKWQSVYVGPFTVLKVINSHLVQIRRHPHNVSLVVGRDKLKPVRDYLRETDPDRTPTTSRGDGGTNDSWEPVVPGRLANRKNSHDKTTDRGRPGRIRNQPRWMNDYMMSAAYLCRNMRTREEERRGRPTKAPKNFQCRCGAAFTTRRSSLRHARRHCHQEDVERPDRPAANMIDVAAQCRLVLDAAPSRSVDEFEAALCHVGVSDGETTVRMMATWLAAMAVEVGNHDDSVREPARVRSVHEEIEEDRMPIQPSAECPTQSASDIMISDVIREIVEAEPWINTVVQGVIEAGPPDRDSGVDIVGSFDGGSATLDIDLDFGDRRRSVTHTTSWNTVVAKDAEDHITENIVEAEAEGIEGPAMPSGDLNAFRLTIATADHGVVKADDEVAEEQSDVLTPATLEICVNAVCRRAFVEASTFRLVDIIRAVGDAGMFSSGDTRLIATTFQSTLLVFMALSGNNGNMGPVVIDEGNDNGVRQNVDGKLRDLLYEML